MYYASWGLFRLEEHKKVEKAEKQKWRSREAKKQKSKEAEKQRSREAEKGRDAEKQKAEKTKSKEAGKEKSKKNQLPIACRRRLKSIACIIDSLWHHVFEFDVLWKIIREVTIFPNVPEYNCVLNCHEHESWKT